MRRFSQMRLPLTLPLVVVLFAVVVGCSHPLEVDLPADFHGHVTVLCDRFTRDAQPIHAGSDGMARGATCPRSQTDLVVVRGGQPVKPAQLPKWTTTGDGIVLSIELDVP